MDSVSGAHAGGIAVELLRLGPSGQRARVFLSETDDGGRLSEQVSINSGDSDERYEMVFQIGAYFTNHPSANLGGRIIEEVVVRFRMPDPHGLYHIPLILAPNSYSMWWSD